MWRMKVNEVMPVAEEKGKETSNNADQNQHEQNQATIKFEEAVLRGLIKLNNQWVGRITAV